MSTYYVGGHHPMHRKAVRASLNKAIDGSMDGDTIILGRHSLTLTDPVIIRHHLTIIGDGKHPPIITVPHGCAGLHVGTPDAHNQAPHPVNLTLKHVNIRVDRQANGLVMSPGCANTLTMDHCSVDWTGKALKANPGERYDVIRGNGLGIIGLIGTTLDGGFSLDASRIQAEDCTIGGTDMTGTANMPVPCIRGKIALTDCRVTGTLIQAEDGQLHRIDTGGGLVVNGKAVITQLHDRAAPLDPGRSKRRQRGRIEPLFSTRGGCTTAAGRPIAQNIAIKDIELIGDDVTPVSAWNLNVTGTVSISNGRIARMEHPSAIHGGGTLAMTNVVDRSDYPDGITLQGLSLDHCHGTLARLRNSQRTARRRDSDALAAIQRMTGLGQVKQQLADLITTSMVNNERIRQGLSATSANMNMAFLGPAGTGKTTVARLMGQALYDIGSIPSPKFIERKIGDLKGVHVGEAARNMDQACEDAMGGTLFLDEAYALSADDVYTPDLVTELLKYSDDTYRGKLVIILAGYRKELEHTLQTANTGLGRRFPNRIIFEPYTGEELHTIALSMLADSRMSITPDADALFTDWIRTTTQTLRQDPAFGNAGWMRTRVDALTMVHNRRLVAEGAMGGDALTVIDVQDMRTFIDEQGARQ